jgi:tetratricopeptide (TPR) repeat protein
MRARTANNLKTHLKTGIADAIETTSDERLAMARDIINFEARRDRAGHLSVYYLPANDGGGRYEVAGINERYDGPAVRKLVELLHEGKFDEAETYAEEYIAGNTDSAELLTHSPRIESYMRDIVFNRGQRGAVKTLQIALDVDVDGKWGPKSKAAMAAAQTNPNALLDRLRLAREEYERKYVGYRANFWRGLVNRWNSSLRVARSYPVDAGAKAVA